MITTLSSCLATLRTQALLLCNGHQYKLRGPAWMALLRYCQAARHMTRPNLKNERVASRQCRSFNVPKGPVPENRKVCQDIKTSLGAITVVVTRSLSDGPRLFCFNGDSSSLTVTVVRIGYRCQSQENMAHSRLMGYSEYELSRRVIVEYAKHIGCFRNLLNSNNQY